MNRYKKFIILFALVSFVFSFNVALAVDYLPIVQCGRSDNDLSATADQKKTCTTCDFVKMIKNVVDLILYAATPMIATAFFVWAGFQMLLSGASPGLYSKGKNILTNTIYGVAIVLAAWLITNTLIQTIGPEGLPGNWWEFECPAGLP